MGLKLDCKMVRIPVACLTKLYIPRIRLFLLYLSEKDDLAPQLRIIRACYLPPLSASSILERSLLPCGGGVRKVTPLVRGAVGLD